MIVDSATKQYIVDLLNLLHCPSCSTILSEGVLIIRNKKLLISGMWTWHWACESMKVYSGNLILIARIKERIAPRIDNFLLYLYPEEWDTKKWEDLPINRVFVRSPVA